MVPTRSETFVFTNCILHKKISIMNIVSLKILCATVVDFRCFKMIQYWLIFVLKIGLLCADAAPSNNSNGLGYELLLTKMDYLEYKCVISDFLWHVYYCFDLQISRIASGD